MVQERFVFDAAIIRAEDMDAAYVIFPFEVKEIFGTRGMVRVNVWFDAYYYRGILVSMGLPQHCIGINKKIRKAIAKQPGDIVHVVLEKDNDPR